MLPGTRAGRYGYGQAAGLSATQELHGRLRSRTHFGVGVDIGSPRRTVEHGRSMIPHGVFGRVSDGGDVP